MKARIKKPERLAPTSYRDGAEGMIAWCEAKVCIPIYPPGSVVEVWCPMNELPTQPDPITGRSYQEFWDAQKEVLRACLIMEDGLFKFSQIIFCWMRGEGKSFIVCLIQIWKFFCWPRQKIMLGANSKEQVKFVHFDIMRDIIRNSPELLRVVGQRNLQEKEIRITNRKNEVTSLIRSIATSSGIVSNITGYTFSEMFDMKNHKFYVQLDGSIRNIPNALGIIDSTVSEKGHVLHNLYQGVLTGTTAKVYFSYRYSKYGVQEDYWHPRMDNAQLNDYRIKFPFGEFERYFLNAWEAGTERVFTDPMIDEMGILGIGNDFLNHKVIAAETIKKAELIESMNDTAGKGFMDGAEELSYRVNAIEASFNKVSSVYCLQTDFEGPAFATLNDIEKIGELLDTDWVILAGLDFSDPMAIRGQARTILTLVAKGLPGSRSMSNLDLLNLSAPKFLYIVLFILNNEKESVDVLKEKLELIHNDLDGIDSLCSERYGSWDLITWCEERRIKFEPTFPSYDRQRDAFKEFYVAMKEGRFKSPPVPVRGSKMDDILREEMTTFDHDPIKRWFGSREKNEKYGIQDDCLYSAAWCLYGGRILGINDFRPRKPMLSFGHFYSGHSSYGIY